MFYFAYGSTMPARRLKARVPSSETVGVAVLDRHRLAFHKRGFDGSAKCDVIETGSQEDRVYGVVYEIGADQLPQLDTAEGRGFGYERGTVSVTPEGRSPIIAECHFATGIGTETAPYSWYLHHVLTGARQERLHGISRGSHRSQASLISTRNEARELALYAGEDA
ncbi:gamma-glutamylcyclotransferase family protein [Massilia jejuensis]|uniref:Gamma-glutamylcyclotransferase family protein n=1 Tax=Massilia jejuensis TaxID=648894 RepID=A0ABW0PHQ6_9BURK